MVSVFIRPSYPKLDYFSYVEHLSDEIVSHELAIRHILRLIENAKYYGPSNNYQ